MKTFKNFVFLITACLVGVVLFGCTKNEGSTPQRDGLMQQTVLKGDQLDAFNAKMKLFPPPVQPPISSRAPISYIAELCDTAVTGEITVQTSIYVTNAWHYYSFVGQAGDIVDITMLRITCHMDPAFYVLYGTTTDGDDPFGNMEFVAFGDDDIPESP